MAPPRQNDAEASSGSVGAGPQDIYSQAIECRDLLDKYLMMSTPYSKQASAYQQRFLTWASFLGVFASENASLDRRLEFNPDIKELVLAMLRVLKRNLERGLVLHTPAYFANSRAEAAVEDDGAMYGITGAVDRLHRLAVAIRQSSRTDEVERVRNFASKQEPDGFANVISAMMEFLFPDAEKTLQAQLVESIVYRRYRMLWSRRHSKKLSQERKPETAKKPVEAETSGPNKESSSGKTVPAPLPQRQPHHKPQVKSSYSSTVPSRRPLGGTSRLLQIMEECQGEDARSARSSNPPPRAQYPELPKVPPGETKLSCPYCLADIKISSNPIRANQDWINHLNADLRPYVCVSEVCKNVPVAFGSTKEWKSHMENSHGAEWARQIHCVKWYCPFCGDDAGPFSSEDLLAYHLKDLGIEKHSRSLDEFEIDKITSKNKVTRRRESNQCPLCMWPDRDKSSAPMGEPETPFLQPHLVHHLQQLALLSISWWDQDIRAAANETLGSCYGSANAIRLNSQIDADQEKQTGVSIFLGDDALVELEKTRNERDYHSQLLYLTLEMQQQALWGRLEPVLDRDARLDCERIRREIDSSDLPTQEDLFKQLDHLHDQLRLKAEEAIPQEKRLEQIIGDWVEPPNDPLGGVTRSDVEELSLGTSFDDNTAVKHMMRIHALVQEILPSLELLEVPGYDNDSFRNAIHSAGIQIGLVENGEFFVLSPDNLKQILTHTFIQTFFYHLVESVSSIGDGDKESVVRYCTDEVQNLRAYHFFETKEEKLASRRKLFAILSLIQMPAMIVFFIRHNMSDLDLPFSDAPLHLGYFQCQSGRQIPIPSDPSENFPDKFFHAQHIICGVEKTCEPDYVSTLEGHNKSVWSVAFSPDSKLLASGSDDHTIKIWEAVTGTLRQTLEGHNGSVNSVAFSPDSKLLASGSDDHTIKIWEVAIGTLRQTLEGHGGWVNSIAFSPDSKLLASGSADHTIKIWEAVTGTLRQTLKGHNGSVSSVAFSPASKLLTSGSADHTFKIWEAVTGTLRQTLEGHNGSVNSVAFSPDSKLLASGSDDHTIKIWEVATGTLRKTLEGHGGWVNSIAFSPDSKLLASGSDDYTIESWEMTTGALRQTLERHSALD